MKKTIAFILIIISLLRCTTENNSPQSSIYYIAYSNNCNIDNYDIAAKKFTKLSTCTNFNYKYQDLISYKGTGYALVNESNGTNLVKLNFSGLSILNKINLYNVWGNYAVIQQYNNQLIIGYSYEDIGRTVLAIKTYDLNLNEIISSNTILEESPNTGVYLTALKVVDGKIFAGYRRILFSGVSYSTMIFDFETKKFLKEISIRSTEFLALKDKQILSLGDGLKIINTETLTIDKEVKISSLGTTYTSTNISAYDSKNNKVLFFQLAPQPSAGVFLLKSLNLTSGELSSVASNTFVIYPPIAYDSKNNLILAMNGVTGNLLVLDDLGKEIDTEATQAIFFKFILSE